MAVPYVPPGTGQIPNYLNRYNPNPYPGSPLGIGYFLPPVSAAAVTDFLFPGGVATYVHAATQGDYQYLYGYIGQGPSPLSGVGNGDPTLIAQYALAFALYEEGTYEPLGAGAVDSFNNVMAGEVSAVNAQIAQANQNQVINDPVGAASGLANGEIAYALSLAAYVQSVATGLSGLVLGAASPYVLLAQSSLATALATVNSLPGTATQTVATAQQQVAAEQAAVTAMANAVVNGTVLPAVAGLQATIGQSITSLTATANGLLATALGAAAAVTGLAAQQQAAAVALANAQGAAAQTAAANAQQQALAQAAAAQTLAANTIASATATAQAAAAMALAMLATQVASFLAQLQDRPLYYGALTTPITIYNTTDVIVIPPGGLVITAD